MQEVPELSLILESKDKFRFQAYVKYGFALWQKYLWLISSYVVIFVGLVFMEKWWINSTYYTAFQDFFGVLYFSYIHTFIETILLSVFMGGLYFRLIKLIIYGQQIHWLNDFFATSEDTLRFVYVGISNFIVALTLRSCMMITPQTPFDAYIAFALFVNMSINILIFLWTLFTLFALPILIIYDISWLESLKSSYYIIKQRFWYFLGFMILSILLLRLDITISYLIAINAPNFYDIYLIIQPIYQIFAYSVGICIFFMVFQHFVLKIEPDNTIIDEEINHELMSKIEEIGENEHE